MNTFYYGFAVYSIQTYIFETNKLKEIIGASEIVESICETEFQSHFDNFLGNATILLKAAGNIRCVFSISNKDLDAFKKTYANFSKELTLKFPELKFCQAIHSLEQNQEITPQVITQLNQALTNKKQRPIIYPRLASMGVDRNQRTRKIQAYNSNKDFDLAIAVKQQYKDGKLLLEKLDGIHANFPKEMEEIASEQSYIALIHIDTNGLGQIIEKLIEDHNYNEVKQFSEEVEKSTLLSLTTAIAETFPEVTKETNEDLPIPFRPVIIGGDDITVIIKAEYALDFTNTYINTFENETKEIEIRNGEPLTVGAGIAFTKQKFPLHYTADLVEDLCKSAKDGSNRKYSAICMHRVRNTYAHDFDRIIHTELSIKGKKKFHTEKPFDITELNQFQEDSITIKKEGFPKGDLEEYISQIIVNNPQSDFLKNRIREKLPQHKAEFIQDMKQDQFDLPYLYNLINLQKFTAK